MRGALHREGAGLMDAGAAGTLPGVPRFYRANERKNQMLRKLILLLMLSGGLVVAACNTVDGVGRDVESVGEATQDAAN